MTHDEFRRVASGSLGGRTPVAEGQDDFTRGHISVRLPDDPARFLMKPHSIGLDEITAANILTIGLDGEVVAGTGAPAQRGLYPLRGLQARGRT